MKKIFMIFIVMLTLTDQVLGQTLLTREEGAIEQMLENRVYVRGLMGSHVFEMISACSWCERGTPVAINFESLSRASMTPYPNSLQVAPVRLFVIRDGREDNL